jgi:hypothetical protein
MRAFQAYAARRRRHGEAGSRRILADFVIGAHALQNGFRLLTLDDRIYRAAFPTLKIASLWPRMIMLDLPHLKRTCADRS